MASVEDEEEASFVKCHSMIGLFTMIEYWDGTRQRSHLTLNCSVMQGENCLLYSEQTLGGSLQIRFVE